ncbi:MAG: acetyl-CoA carboxylase carboxyltransferase subunit beta [Brevinematales bacterium]|nr:acetyl-CoA carboxylase carboxyltransferase subunit beta [Brevinematales bacterium]
MAWFLKQKYNIKKGVHHPVQDGLWHKCPSCNSMIYNKDWEENLKVCPNCEFHDKLNAFERIQSLIDPGTFNETNNNIVSVNPLDFNDGKIRYELKVHGAMEKTMLKEAVVIGHGKLNGVSVELAVMDFSFLGGSMGSVVGEKITIAIEEAIKHKRPMLIFSASGGARMHEGILSLMQMAKTSAALKRLSDAGELFISVLTDPTTGGVTASFAMLGDIIISEPEALIGFAGPRVIEQTIRQKLPPGFQRAAFLQDHGFVDIIVKRKDLKKTIFELINYTH